MTKLEAGATFPRITLSLLGGQDATLGVPQGGHDWQMIVVYRGLHCPICKSYLKDLDAAKDSFFDVGVDVIAISADPEEKARRFVEETSLDLPVGHDLSLSQMAELGVYVSEPRSPQETDRPFAEPAVFVVNRQGKLQIVDLSNAPFARPDLGKLAQGIGFIRKNDYPVRGTRAAA